MKKLFAVVAMMLVSSVAFAGPFDAIDEENKRVSEFTQNAVGSAMEQTIKKEHPEVTGFEWGARGQGYDEDTQTATYLVYCEAKNKAEVLGYWYIEVAISLVNGNSKLIKKYGLE